MKAIALIALILSVNNVVMPICSQNYWLAIDRTGWLIITLIFVIIKFEE